jgi:DNA-binding CsgD family transcriptional regulator
MKEQLDRIEWKLDQIMGRLVSESSSQIATGEGLNTQTANSLDRQGGGEPRLDRLTTKQHATLQMLRRGCTNREIAERLLVSENTIKGNIKAIAKHYDVRTRTQVLLATSKEFDDTPEDAYIIMSGGLPKGWDLNYEEPDVYVKLYGVKRRDK